MKRHLFWSVIYYLLLYHYTIPYQYVIKAPARIHKQQLMIQGWLLLVKPNTSLYCGCLTCILHFPFILALMWSNPSTVTLHGGTWRGLLCHSQLQDGHYCACPSQFWASYFKERRKARKLQSGFQRVQTCLAWDTTPQSPLFHDNPILSY